MFKFRPFTMDQLRANAAAKGHVVSTPTQAMAEGPQPRPLNVRAVLDLGTLFFFTWRGRMYGVPPLPWKRGAELLDVFLEAREVGYSLTRATSPTYYRALGRMSKIMWKCTRPVGWFPRLMRMLGLFRNPFRHATEAELAALALFYLGRRMTTRGTLTETPTPQTPTSRMI